MNHRDAQYIMPDLIPDLLPSERVVLVRQRSHKSRRLLPTHLFRQQFVPVLDDSLYVLTDMRVLCRQKNVWTTLYLDNIRVTHYTTRDPFEQLLNTGDVIFHGQASQQIVFRNVDAPNQIIATALELQKGAIASRLGLTGPVFERITRGVRQDEGDRSDRSDRIVFREHPIFLARRLSRPAIFMLGVLVVMLMEVLPAIIGRSSAASLGSLTKYLNGPVTNLLGPQAAAVLLSSLLAVLLVVLWFELEVWRNRKLLITSSHVVLVRGLPLGLFQERRQVEWVNVDDVSADLNLDDESSRNTGTLRIRTVYGGDLVFERIAYPEKARSEVLSRLIETVMRYLSVVESESDMAGKQYALSLFLARLDGKWIDRIDPLEPSSQRLSTTLRLLDTSQQQARVSPFFAVVENSEEKLVQLDERMMRLGITTRYVALIGMPVDRWDALVRCARKWIGCRLVLTSLDSGNSFSLAVTELVEQLCGIMSIPYTADSINDASNMNWLSYTLDTSRPFAGTRLRTQLPFVFLRRPNLLESDPWDLQRVLGNRRLALFAGFAGNNGSVENSQLIEKMRAVYAYDVVPLSFQDAMQFYLAQDPGKALRRLVLPRTNLAEVSPFTDQGQTPDDMFVGREHELREVTDHARTQSFAIVGGRRIGKTSILGRLHRIRLPAAGYRAAFLDCSSTSDYDSFVHTLVSQWQPQPPVGAALTLGGILEDPPADKPLILLFDEADKLVPLERKSGWPLFSKLRSLVNQRQVQIVLGGERTLDGALRDPESPLFNLASKLVLGPLSYPDVEELVTRPLKQMEIELDDAGSIVRRIFEFTSGHPNVVQILCCRLIERLNRLNVRRISLEMVDSVIKDPKFQERDFLAVFWERATPLEQIISLLMAKEVGVYRLQDVLDLLGEHSIRSEPRVTKDALDRLVDLRSILRRSQTGYEFAVTAFPLVIANTTTAEDLLIVLKSQYLNNPMESPE